MRNLILILIFMILSFSVNILFYYVSDDYRDFLKQLKNDENIDISINNESSNTDKKEQYGTGANDSQNINNGDIIDNQNDIQTQDKSDSIVVPDSNDEQSFIEELPVNKEINLGKNYKKILDLFSSYDLSRMEVNTNLFDITNEYPDDYLEYYSKNLTLYFFTTKRYTDLKDIFNVLEQELPFTINEINNFGDNSFFINLDDDIDDNIVRIVISNDGIVFGLKINKNDYNLVKEKLNTLRIN